MELAELHIPKARDMALRVASYASTIIPDEWGSAYSKLVICDVVEFALFARRTIDLCRFQEREFSSVGINRHKVQNPEVLNLENNLHFALNRIIHAKNVTVSYTLWGGPKVFLASPENKILSYLKIETDRRAYAHVSLFGVSFVFLTEVIAAIKETYPTVQF